MFQCISDSILLNELLKNLNEIIVVVNLQTDIVEFTNSVADKMLGYDKADFEKIKMEWFRYPLSETELYSKFLKDLRRKDDKSVHAVMCAKNQDEILVDIKVAIFEQNNTQYKIIIAKDASDKLDYARKLYHTTRELERTILSNKDELKKNMSRLQSYEKALDVNSIVSITDPKGKITYVNKLFEDVSGFSADESIGENHSIVRHPDVPNEIFDEMWQTIKEKQVWRGKLLNKRKNGEKYYIDAAIVPILDANGEIVEYIATRHDITELVEQKDALQKAAKTDHLTGLGNRFKLYDILHSSKQAQVALIDINGFHQINDFYGASFGDEFIRLFAKTIFDNLDSKYELFHLNADEFIILNLTEKKDVFIDDMKTLNNTMSSIPIEMSSRSFAISTTTSLSFERPDLLLSTVNMSHSFAKRHKELFVIYSGENSLEDEYAENIRWSKIIRQAILDDRIIILYQPIIDTQTLQVQKYEVLVRLVAEDGTIISPLQFLQQAKQSGQYPEISKIVVEKTLAKLNETGLEFSINITIEDILNKKFNKFLEEKLNDCKLCSNLTFEIVESEGIENFDKVNDFIKKIRSYGCKLAIDDFGTGYSNFEYLLKLSSDYVKIDGSLIKKIDTSQDYYDIVKTIVEFANVKKLTVIAEFVSSEAIFNKILELKIPYAQGYYFSPPKPL